MRRKNEPCTQHSLAQRAHDKFDLSEVLSDATTSRVLIARSTLKRFLHTISASFMALQLNSTLCACMRAKIVSGMEMNGHFPRKIWRNVPSRAW